MHRDGIADTGQVVSQIALDARDERSLLPLVASRSVEEEEDLFVGANVNAAWIKRILQEVLHHLRIEPVHRSDDRSGHRLLHYEGIGSYVGEPLYDLEHFVPHGLPVLRGVEILDISAEVDKPVLQIIEVHQP